MVFLYLRSLFKFLTTNVENNGAQYTHAKRLHRKNDGCFFESYDRSQVDDTKARKADGEDKEEQHADFFFVLRISAWLVLHWVKLQLLLWSFTPKGLRLLAQGCD
jgi:hypothetical protein